MDNKKYLDQEGVKYLWSKISMEDYPNNETLMAVISAIDETKSNNSEVVKHIAQTLDETQKAQARENIDVLSLSEINDLLEIDYDNLLAFNTSEIVFDTTLAVATLGRAILGQAILGMEG